MFSPRKVRGLQRVITHVHTVNREDFVLKKFLWKYKALKIFRRNSQATDFFNANFSRVVA